MVQEFCVLQRYACHMFQVQIVKKSSKKWSCKVCGEKQTIIKIFGQGSAKDCRNHVQELNLKKGLTREFSDFSRVENDPNFEEIESQHHFDEEANIEYLDVKSEGEDFNSKSSVTAKSNNWQCYKPSTSNQSKWSCFLDSDSEEQNF